MQATGFLLTLPLFLLAGSHLHAAAVRFDVVREPSVIAVRTGKAGLLSALGAGHTHGIVATEFSARICADPQTLREASVSFAVPTRSLRIDTPEARRAAGLTAAGPAASDVPVIQEKMLSQANLAAAEHAAVAFASTAIDPKDSTLVVRGSLTIRGRSNPVTVPLRVERSRDRYRFFGSFSLRLTDYGIKAESIGGVVKVADEVTVVVALTAVPTTESCR